MSRRRALVADANLFDFFRERIESAVVHQRAEVTEEAVYYLSNLLAEQVRRGDGGDEEDDPTMVELQVRAVNAPIGEAVTLWRRMGDTSLLVTGFFPEHLERRRVSRDYYAHMGAGAYRALQRLLGAGGFAQVFAELAARYHTCSEVIAEVRDETRERTDTDILKLYEEWLATGSPRVAERLRELGVIPMRTLGNG